MAAEHFLEKIAEAAVAAACEDFLEIDAAVATPETTGRRLHFIARPVAPRSQLVVGGALFGIAQRLVGLIDGFECLFRSGLLAHIRVVFARKPAIGGLDFRFPGAGFDPEHFVVILEAHAADPEVS